MRVGKLLAVVVLVGTGLFASARDAQMFGYQLDVSRCKVPTMETLYRIVDILARLDYNQFQLYTEHTFAYARHRTVWAEASPLTSDEIRALDDYCAARGIELVPNQNSFGHLAQWLRHPEYNDLSELPQGGAQVTRWGGFTTGDSSSLCPTDPRCLTFLAGLYDELFPCFRSRYVNVGCDETLELEDTLGRGRSAAAIAAHGRHRVYLDFLKQIQALCAARGHTMMFWGDIVLEHPEVLSELPKDVICLNWGYEANQPFERQGAELERMGCSYLVCPGTSAWGSLSGRTANMMGNIKSAVAAARRHGAKGTLLADWGDGGHPNPWIVSLPAIVYHAACRAGEDPSRTELAAKIDTLLGCRVGSALLAYGDVYEKANGRMDNTSELFFLLREGLLYRRARGVTDETLAAALEQVRTAQSLAELETAPAWVREDFETLALLYRAVEKRIREPGKANFRGCFEPEYRRLWLRQNRPGGLSSSIDQLFGRR